MFLRVCAFGLLATAALWSCGEAPPADEPPGRPLTKKNKSGNGGQGGEEGGQGGSSDGGSGGAGGAGPAGGPSGGAGSGGSGQSGAGAGGAPSTSGLPCEIEALFAAKCQQCHSDPPKGAPMPLVDHDDLMKPSQGKTLAQVSLDRMQNLNAPMPPKGSPEVTASELSAYKAWVNQGAPKTTCQPPTGGAGGVGGAGGASGTSGQAGDPFGGGGALQGSCATLSGCCDGMKQDPRLECLESIDTALKKADSDKACGEILAKLKGAGLCEAEGGIPNGERCGLVIPENGDACNDCFDALCCEEATICKNDPTNSTCAAALACLSECAPGNGACQSNCSIKYSGGMQIFIDVLHCVQDACRDVCGTGVKGGAGGAAGAAGGPACIPANNPCSEGQTCCDGGACSPFFKVCQPCAQPGQPCSGGGLGDGFGAGCCKGSCSASEGVCPSCVPLGQFCLSDGAFCCEGECSKETGVCALVGQGGAGGASGAGGAGGGACIKDQMACSPNGLPCCNGGCDPATLKCKP
jgi:hypothetical protein